MDAEIYVEHVQAGDLIIWFETLLGPLHLTLEDDGNLYLLTADSETSVVLIHSEDPAYLSATVGGQVIPWTKSEQIAIPCCEELGKTVRWCDEETNEFMEKQPGKPPEFIFWDL